MCGKEDDPSTTDDDPFSVTLPGTSLGFANGGFFEYSVASGPSTAPPDTVTLPRGCRIYLFIVSGYGENSDFSQMPFYKVAQHVASIGGYVHVSWWNNFNKEYMGGPLHQTTTTIQSLNGLFGNIQVATNPGGYDQDMQVPGIGFVSNFLDKPKAVPVEDTQFIRDARLVLKAVRTQNPTAKIVVIGHGMGAHAAAKLGSITISSTQITPIDLLALIDPVGNQDNPRDVGAEMLARGSFKIGFVNLAPIANAFFGDAMNWSRWRATHLFRGYREWDCVRGLFGICKILFIGGHHRAHCVGSGPWLNEFPSRLSGAPLFCPNVLPDIDPGTRLDFSTNVKNLYHRWQKEYFAPSDFLDNEFYLFRGKDNYSSATTAANSQAVKPTCKSGADPNDPGRVCSAFDGHGELIGIRGGNALGQNKTYPGLAMQDWSTHPAVRRSKLREMATAGESWAHRPENPDLCLVCDDIIDIINRITPPLPPPPPTTDDTAPQTSPTPIPGPNPSGWNAEDVTIELQALDDDEGSGVKLLNHARSGAETLPETTIEGDSAQVTVAAEGVTTLRYFATDHDGNSEEPRELVVRIDKTGPDVSAEPNVPPNAAGWNRTNVILTFQADDALSGVVAVSPVTVVETEGEAQPIVGGATDQAGNQGTITVTLNIDKTAPQLSVETDVAANGFGWNNGDVTVRFPASDALSGVLFGTPDQTVSTEGLGHVIEGTATDNADNTATESIVLNIDKTLPQIAASTDIGPNSFGWNSSDVRVSFTASDLLSGLAFTSADVVVSTEGGDQAIPGTAEDRADNSASASAIVNIDKTAPQISAVPTVAANSQGWHNTDVVVRFEASDALSGIAENSPDAIVSTEGAGQSVSGTATDKADHTASASVLLNIDKTAPQITAATSIAPNSHDWFGSDVTVSFAASDSLSGLAFTTPEQLVSSEGAGQDIVGTANDNADNSATASVIVNIDKTAPQITAAANTTPNSNGWYGGDVVVSFAASDALSGLAFSSPDVVVSTEGALQEIPGTAKDKADHTANASLIVNIDKTAPAIALSSRTPANGAGWNKTDVALTWNCSDALSGPVVNQVSASLTGEGAAQTTIGTCADRAGHTASNTQADINIDKTSPTGQITTPANGAVYLLNAIVNAAYGCADGLSGVSACVGTVGAGAAVDTATVGDKTFNVSAADAAGNQGAASHSYTVQYKFSGFSNPIAAMPAVNTAKAGRTVPVKYSLGDVNGAAISDLTSFVSLISAPVACDTNVPTAAAEETDAAGSTTIEFESGQFIYNWKTQSAWEGTCRVLQLTLKDGTRHMVTFQFK